jgi:hypothetical protein
MKLKSFTPIVILGLSLSMYSSMLMTHTPIAHAQLDESRKSNWETSKKLYPMMVDAVAAQRIRDGYNAANELRLNLDIVQSKLEVVGQRLHEKDKNWQWNSKLGLVIQNLREAKVSIGLLESKLKDPSSSPDSELGYVKTNWAKFVVSFDDLWAEYVKHGQELDAMVKAFGAECPGCR